MRLADGAGIPPKVAPIVRTPVDRREGPASAAAALYSRGTSARTGNDGLCVSLKTLRCPFSSNATTGDPCSNCVATTMRESPRHEDRCSRIGKYNSSSRTDPRSLTMLSEAPNRRSTARAKVDWSPPEKRSRTMTLRSWPTPRASRSRRSCARTFGSTSETAIASAINSTVRTSAARALQAESTATRVFGTPVKELKSVVVPQPWNAKNPARVAKATGDRKRDIVTHLLSKLCASGSSPCQKDRC